MTHTSISPAARRRRWAWLAAAPFLALALIEAGLRVAHDLGGGLRGWMYLSGGWTDFESADSLAELLELSGQPLLPLVASNDFVLNSRGLRTGEYRQEKSDGRLRIVVLGDSHTWASGDVPYPLLWHNRVAAELARGASRPVEVISLAVPAVGPDFELRMWEVEGARLAPGLVVLAFSVGNDFAEAEGGLADVTLADRLARRSYTLRLARNAWRLRDTGFAAHLAGAAEKHRVGGVLREGVAAVYDRARPRYTAEQHELVMSARIRVSDTRPGPTAKFDGACAHVAQVLSELQRSVQARGARLVLLAIPDEHQVDDALLARLAAQQGITPARYDIQRPQRFLRELCAAHGILFVDALAALRERAGEQPMFNLRETHLNDLGHAVLAELVTAALRGERLVD